MIMIPESCKNLLKVLKCKLETMPPEGEGDHCLEDMELKWSKGPGFSIMPYGLELAGVVPCPIGVSEPKNKKNCFKYFLVDDFFAKAEIYGVSSTIVETEIYENDIGASYSIRFDDDGEAIRAVGVVFKDEVPSISCRLEDDGEYWCYEYRHEEGEIISMVVHATNSVPGAEIFVERKEGGVVGLYFYNQGAKVYVYKI